MDDNMTMILEGGEQLDLTKEQAQQLDQAGIVYFCDEDDHNCYHVAPSFMHQYDDDAERALTAIEARLKPPETERYLVTWKIDVPAEHADNVIEAATGHI